MNRFDASARWGACALAFAAATLGALPPAQAAPERGLPARVVTEPRDAAEVARVIVKYRADSPMRKALAAGTGSTPAWPLHAQTLSRRVGVPLKDGRVLGPQTQSLRGSGLSTGELVRRLQALPDVEWVVADERRSARATTNDPLLRDNQLLTTPTAGQWYLRAPNGTVVSAINAVTAWDTTTGRNDITVAVLDTGVRLDHPDLSSKFRPGYDFVSDEPTAADGNARDSDPSDPGDGVAAGQCGVGAPAENSSWHGTQVSGLVGAATNNNTGIAGTGHQTMVLPVRVLGKCGGFDSDIIAAMRWAAGLSDQVGLGGPISVRNTFPAKVINLSLGSTGPCTAAYQAVMTELELAGVTTVVAAGNDAGQDVGAPGNCTNAFTVAGLRHTGTKVGYSNVGREVGIAAPAGNCVNLTGTCLYPLVTTTNNGAQTPGANTYSTGEDATLGTSFAAPLVSGTVALMLAVDRTLTPANIRSIIQSTARPFPNSGAGPEVGNCRQPDGTEQLECYCTTSTFTNCIDTCT